MGWYVCHFGVDRPGGLFSCLRAGYCGAPAIVNVTVTGRLAPRQRSCGILGMVAFNHLDRLCEVWLWALMDSRVNGGGYVSLELRIFKRHFNVL